ncbi:hypothetical protein [Nannocystis punicea]|uniref:Uncharacterized protein n=1 Tax=Nannocystis punicea TaxID=2995304 RepID=A0ABY7GTF3_9BACT|nr:hypothetical protein [Nannocystis poenicansa]WAS90188.1 hypothetical protein O0S08_28675 [Nannocystis poenicansa]
MTSSTPASFFPAAAAHLASLSSSLAFALLLACGPQPATTDGTTGESTTTTGSTTGGAPVTTGGEPGTTTSSTTSPASTDDSTTGAASTTGAGFIPLSDGGTCLVGHSGDGQVRCIECDPWSQNCPADGKCNAYAPHPDGTWDALKCVPLFPDPDHAGEPCTVEGAPMSGIDSCDLDSMCFHVDPDTLVGTCVRRCAGSPEAPECPAGRACHVSHDGNLALCLPQCDPLLADCPMGQVCIPTSHQDFACAPDLSGAGGQAFSPCADEAACDPGLACVDAGLAAECDPQQTGFCCLPFCDLDQPPACPGAGQQCLPFVHPGWSQPVPGGPGLCTLAP